MTDALPPYTQAELKTQLLAAGVSGTVYALVMPETEAAMAQVVDGCDRGALLDDAAALDAARAQWLGMYRAPWTQRQDAMHEAYFDRWLAWSAPVVWRHRHHEVDAAMIALRDATNAGDRRDATLRHRDWLLSDAVTGGGDIPFEAEARAFRTTFDQLLATYDAAMTRRALMAVRHTT